MGEWSDFVEDQYLPKGEFYIKMKVLAVIADNIRALTTPVQAIQTDIEGSI